MNLHSVKWLILILVFNGIVSSETRNIYETKKINGFQPTEFSLEKKLGSRQSPMESDCKYQNIELYGKVKFVESFPDIKIQFVESFPDIKVKFVSSFPNECGKWQVVESFPDFTVQIVESFPDIKVKTVDSFPGMN